MAGLQERRSGLPQSSPYRGAALPARRRLTPPRTTATRGATAGCLWRARRSAPKARHALCCSVAIHPVRMRYVLMK